MATAPPPPWLPPPRPLTPQPATSTANQHPPAGDMKREGVRTRSQTKKQKASTSSQGNSLPENPFEEEFGSLSDSGQGNNTLFFACTGITTVNNPKTTSFLTSLSLIEVRLPDNKIELGWLQFYDLKHTVAVINIIRYHSLQVACLDHQRQIESQSKVVAVGRCFNSGKLMATAGMLTDNPGGAYHEELGISTFGGPLVDFNGDFIGMNFYAEKETPFLPRNTIRELLLQFSKIIPWWATSKKRPDSTIRKFSRPHKSDSQGRKRCFACTGVFIDCNGSTTRVLTSASLVRTSDDENTVADNLKIVVCLPDNRRTTGTLQHYSLHYNIAVVHIMGFCCSRTAQINDQMQMKPQMKVVAVGRGYKSGKFLATSGILIDKPSKLNCKELKTSTCKITKAGIGGPLIDLIIWNSTLVHMINNIRSVAVSDNHSPNRWPVPKPFWCYPTWHELEEEVDLEKELKYQQELY
uniref:Uncharacterized protein n=1 Tax=Aegilops tauschii TaxID=37682 RepID=M8BQY6_AEGTA